MNSKRLREGGRIPANIISLFFPLPIFTKYNFSFPSRSLVESLKVEAKPEPPWGVMVVVSASRDRALRIAGSILGDIFLSVLGIAERSLGRIEEEEEDMYWS